MSDPFIRTRMLIGDEPLSHLAAAKVAVFGVGCGGGRLLLSRMARLIATGRVQPEKLITHRYHGMEQIPEAMNLFLHHDRSLIKPVIYND